MIDPDAELLRRYAELRDETAFAELVRRQVNFVYAAALRRVGGDAHLAKDVTQHVFTALARQAGALANRSGRRRRVREEQAEMMNESISNPPVDPEWERLRPVLDQALDHLRDDDREAVLLRFFEGKSFAEIGGRLQLTENAARMRVERALDRMHDALAARGMTSTTAALAVALASQPAIAAPAGLAASVTGAALAGSGPAVASAVFMGMTKLQVGLAAAIAIAGSAGLVVQAHGLSALRAERALVGQIPSTAGATGAAAGISSLAIDSDRATRAELDQLRREADGLRAQLAAVQASATAPTVSRKPAPPFTGLAFEAGQVDVQAKPVYQARPMYPVDLRKAGVPGEALIDFVVDADGKVRNATVVSSTHPAIAQAALEAVEQWEYDAAQKAGQLVAMHTRVPIVFTIREDTQPAANKAQGSAPKAPYLWF
jgi:TonB family protein